MGFFEIIYFIEVCNVLNCVNSVTNFVVDLENRLPNVAGDRWY